MKYLKQTMIMFGVTIFMILIVGLMQAFGWIYDAFGMWFTSISLGVTAVAVIVSFFGQKISWRKIGFYVLHFGLILFLVGQLIYATTGMAVNGNFAVNANNWYGHITTEEKNEPLGFTFQIRDMTVQYYDPIYDVVRMSDKKTVMTDVEIQQGGVCDFGKYGKVNVLSGGSAKDTVELRGGYFAIKRQPVKHYEGTVLYNKPGHNTKTLTIEVNKTLRMGAYKVFLMNYSANTRTVTLLFKKDYGEPVSIIGILMLILGTLYVCLFEKFVTQKINHKLMERARAAKDSSGGQGGDGDKPETGGNGGDWGDRPDGGEVNA